MAFNEIAFVVLVGAVFILMLGLAGLFEASKDYFFDRKKVINRGAEIKTCAIVTLGALALCFAAWIFI